MRPSKTVSISRSLSPKAAAPHADLAGHVGWGGLRLMFMLFVLATAALAVPPDQHREAVVRLVAQVQRADYEGDRAALQSLYASLKPFTTDEKLASRVRYWRGFALWRRAVNGFNESADPTDLEHDLTQAIAEFKESVAKDPTFVDAKIGTISCLNNLTYLALGHSDRVQELIAQSSPLVREVRTSNPDNPRFAWILGPILWNIPAERGGSQDKAIENYQKALAAVHQRKETTSDPLEPSWGEPELLMSLAWSNLNRSTPDVNAAEQNARSALALVPYWHYVRDILLPQIAVAKAKS
jgi:hypothetical protein